MTKTATKQQLEFINTILPLFGIENMVDYETEIDSNSLAEKENLCAGLNSRMQELRKIFNSSKLSLASKKYKIDTPRSALALLKNLCLQASVPFDWTKYSDRYKFALSPPNLLLADFIKTLPGQTVMQPARTTKKSCIISQLYNKLKIYERDGPIWVGPQPRNQQSVLTTQFLASDPFTGLFDDLVKNAKEGVNAVRSLFRYHNTHFFFYREGENIFLYTTMVPRGAVDIVENITEISLFQNEKKIASFARADIADIRSLHNRAPCVTIPIYSLSRVANVLMVPIDESLMLKVMQDDASNFSIQTSCKSILLSNQPRCYQIEGELSDRLSIEDDRLNFYETTECDTHTIYFRERTALDPYKIYSSIQIFNRDDEPIDLASIKIESDAGVNKLDFPLEIGTRKSCVLVCPKDLFYKAIFTFTVKNYSD